MEIFADLPPLSLLPTSWLLQSLQITGPSTHALLGWGGIVAHVVDIVSWAGDPGLYEKGKMR